MNSDDNEVCGMHGGMKAALILNAISLALIILEKIMGPTILGNVIFLGLAFLLSLVALLKGATGLFKRPTKNAKIVSVTGALLIGYVIYRVFMDSVPAGYGP
jgi:hypothetical protein